MASPPVPRVAVNGLVVIMFWFFSVRMFYSARYRSRFPVASRLRQEATLGIASAIDVPDRWPPHGNVIYA
jgi:hypothetical protein